MHQISDETLEACREFLTRPGPTKSPQELMEIVRNLTWAVEELQFRRLAEKTPIKLEEDKRPYLLFGSDDAILEFDQEHGGEWKQATKEGLNNLHPPEWRARKLDGADEELWKNWEELCHIYESKTEGNA